MSSQDEAKERVREYMERRQHERRQNSRSPLHEMEQIRREIGWDQQDQRKEERRKRKDD
jgi:hypothetical protein